MPRFVPVPYDALEGLPPDYWRAAVDLYKRGHQLRWREFCVTERSLSSAWGCSTRQVRNILAAMEGLGLITLTLGKRSIPSRICVADPVARMEQAEPHEERNDEESESRGEARGVAILNEHELNMKEEVCPPEPADPSLPLGEQPPDKPDPWGQAREQWQAHASSDRTSQWMKSKGNGKLLAKLAKMRPDDLALMLRWLRESPGAELGRPPKGTWATSIATVARHRERYLDDARAWLANGAQQAAEKPPGPSPEAEKAWSLVLARISRHGVRMAAREPFSEDATREAAVRSALRVVTLRDIGTADDFGLRALRARFCEAYVGARNA